MESLAECMRFLFTGLPPAVSVGLFFLLGAGVGNLLAKWMIRLTEPVRVDRTQIHAQNEPSSPWWHLIPIAGFFLARGRSRHHNEPVGGWGLFVELGTGLLFAGFVVAMVWFDCQTTTEVQPDEIWRYGRIFYHLTLISLLVAATGTDFREYIIPDSITIPGIAIGVLGATLSGQLQMIHLWVDWNDPMLVLKGAYIPAWIDQSRHWHGFAWSVTGLVTGAGITWLVRAVSKWVLGRDALGFGDVTLMAMIGSFVGWQPIVFIFLLAPLCGLVVGLTVRWIAGRTFLPYGPFLSAATVTVLLSWKWMWTASRNTFGDAPGLAKLAGMALIALIVLLGLIRLYRSIPVQRR